MKILYKTLFICSTFFILTVLTAGMKEKKGDNFLRINDNIQNEELRAELKGLSEEFNVEKSRIQNYYNQEIALIKESRRNEMKTIKKDFSSRREVLMKKYLGKLRNKSKMVAPEVFKNDSRKMKKPKNKNKIRKQ
tara:strand:- start:730 stop:1134 length:405 start_codon:yes stop_codon:yes gene_type:complete